MKEEVVTNIMALLTQHKMTCLQWFPILYTCEYNTVHSLVDELTWTSSLHSVDFNGGGDLSKLVHLLGCKLCCTHKSTK